MRNEKSFTPKSAPLKKERTLSERNLGFFQKAGEKITTIYIGNLSYQKNEKDIKSLFKTYGKVSYVRLMLDPKTMKSKGFAFVQMTSPTNAAKAIKNLDGSELDGRTLKVSVAKERNQSMTVAKVAKVKPKKEKIAEEKAPRRRRDKGLKLLFNHLNS